jgi:dihydroorotate dehydrogenase (NAD+) catalytic subunit
MGVVKPAEVDLSVAIGTLKLANPVIVASGTFGSGKEYSELLDLSRLGAIVCKGVSLSPMEGNEPPRICETPSGMLNSIGLQNPGADAWARDDLPFLRETGVPVIANVLGESVSEYVDVVKRLDRHSGIGAYEINISCPNVAAGGISFGCNASSASQVVSAVRKATKRLLVVKLTPNVTDIVPIARACEDAGADALSLINTVRGMAIDVDTFRPKLARVTGGLSGPAIKPIAVRMVWETARAVKVPVIGMGGISSADDALEFLLAGATAVAVGTAVFVDPSAPVRIIDGLRETLARLGKRSVDEVIGAVQTG